MKEDFAITMESDKPFDTVVANIEENVPKHQFRVLAVHDVQATLDGLTYLYVWPNSVWWNLHSLVILFNLVGIVGLQFTATFLNTRSQLPAWHRLIRGTQAAFLLGGLLALIDYQLSLWLMILLLAAAMLQMVATSFLQR